MRVRRASALVCHWEQQGEFVIRNYLTNGQITASPAIIRVLDAASKAIEWDTLLALTSFLPAATDVLSLLKAETILLVEGSDIESKDKKVDEAWVWGHDARCFHYGTQHVEFDFDLAKVRSFFERKAVLEPPPSPFKKCQGTEYDLPRPTEDCAEEDFWGILSKRRTCREFDGNTAIGLPKLSKLLKKVSGFERYYNDSNLDQRIIKTSPSGGARHPIETYVFAQNVSGLEKGIYHYPVCTHNLVRVANLPSAKIIVRIFGGQSWMADAAAIFVFSAVLPRSMWKYEHSRAYRVITLDAGHLGQTFQMVGTALRLGVFSTAAFDDKSIEDLIGIDGTTEVAIYCGAIGHELSPSS